MWCGVVSCGVVWCDVMWYVVVWCGVVLCCLVWCGDWRGVVQWSGLLSRFRPLRFDWFQVIPAAQGEPRRSYRPSASRPIASRCWSAAALRRFFRLICAERFCPPAIYPASTRVVGGGGAGGGSGGHTPLPLPSPSLPPVLPPPPVSALLPPRLLLPYSLSHSAVLVAASKLVGLLAGGEKCRGRSGGIGGGVGGGSGGGCWWVL